MPISYPKKYTVLGIFEKAFLHREKITTVGYNIEEETFFTHFATHNFIK